ncbi:MAG: hypothetical protein NVS9B12_06810 [Vulcanimicrobiaceae bacterium]
MIVTRQRPKPRQLHKIILPLVAIALLAAALILPASRINAGDTRSSRLIGNCLTSPTIASAARSPPLR